MYCPGDPIMRLVSRAMAMDYWSESAGGVAASQSATSDRDNDQVRALI
jgi:hypothetical protein